MYAKYREGDEGHNLEPYLPLFENAKQNKDTVKLHAGFIPRQYAKNLMREGEEAVLASLKGKDYIPDDISSLEGTDLHFSMFESMISGRNMHDESLKPNDQFKKIFKAQLIKDVAMAHKVNKLLEV